MRKFRHWLCAAVPLTAAFFSIYLLFQAAWIPVKAELAQWLIERSWQAALTGESEAPPWPWADTQAEALLTVPGQDVRLVVLGGNSGRNLAFGPVFLDGWQNSLDRVISGHRDTHFRFLGELKPGDRVQLATTTSKRWFEVVHLEVVDSRHQELLIDPGVERLSLVTCYPFDSPVAGGALRYVVTALPVGGKISPRSSSSG